MLDLKDKMVLITGAAGGTGRQLAQELASRGAIIAAVDINPLGLDETVALIRLAGGRVKDYLFDTAKRLPVVALVDEVLDEWGRIDILINAAEVHPIYPLLTMDEWDFHRTLDVNLAGPFFLMQRVAQAMIKQGGTFASSGPLVSSVGFIVNVCDGETGMDEPAGLPQEGAAYAASKAGLAALTLVAAQELKAYNIQVVGIADFRLLISD